MKILADENCEKEIVDRLRALGHDVVTIIDIAPSIDDQSVFQIAAQRALVLLTSDRDFGVIAERAELRPPAIVLMRLERIGPPQRAELVLKAIAELANGQNGQFIVVEPHQVRARTYDP